MENFEGIESQLLKTESVDEQEEILNLIRVRVSELLERDPELLMSYLYRLDILESKLKEVLKPGAALPIAEAFSQLIFRRQKERVATKKKYKQSPIEGWEF